mmetsp:Transcript_16324/g.44005  ORF Transcript_16324/g.44005 Transcript_16324/m.44005 type:complete len:201 (+) Transcript_16324:1161-1763(+)
MGLTCSSGSATEAEPVAWGGKASSARDDERCCAPSWLTRSAGSGRTSGTAISPRDLRSATSASVVAETAPVQSSKAARELARSCQARWSVRTSKPTSPSVTTALVHAGPCSGIEPRCTRLTALPLTTRTQPASREKMTHACFVSRGVGLSPESSALSLAVARRTIVSTEGTEPSAAATTTSRGSRSCTWSRASSTAEEMA